MKIVATLQMIAVIAVVEAGLASAQTTDAKPEAAEKVDVSQIAQGPFQPTWDSLKQYKCPDWFRDAKFGIWSHWGPQAVPMAGDWYARRMYIPGDEKYAHHLKTYGHPSEFGYKDIIPMWKAEKWDPDRLMALYKKAGARYFVSMGVHHDNFDLWNSKHHRWNAVQMGPKRDVVGEWQKAAQKQGLPFGVSEHLGASYWWFQTSRGADKDGPKAGVPYDGNDPQFEDLYHSKAPPGDTDWWYTKNPEWHREWFARVKDLVDNYKPDLLYTDGGVPFGEVGRAAIANFYNANIQQHDGRLEAVYTCKQMGDGGKHGEFVAGTCVQDMERGALPGINPLPWQTDTSIADWFYCVGWKYRKADWVISNLADIVSKNGNLLLNIVQRPDGSLDPEVEQLLEEVGDWMGINGEAIYGTRPWTIFGEGEVKSEGGHFKEDYTYSYKDVRFTTKGDTTLYAIVLGWPESGKIVVKSLAKGSELLKDEITDVELLGHGGKLDWSRTDEGLDVALPEKKPCNYAFSLKITLAP